MASNPESTRTKIGLTILGAALAVWGALYLANLNRKVDEKKAYLQTLQQLLTIVDSIRANAEVHRADQVLSNGDQLLKGDGVFRSLEVIPNGVDKLTTAHIDVIKREREVLVGQVKAFTLVRGDSALISAMEAMRPNARSLSDHLGDAQKLLLSN